MFHRPATVKRRVRAFCLVTAGFLALLAMPMVMAQTSPEGEADLLIVNGKVIDGTGSPWRQANVAIKGDTIV